MSMENPPPPALIRIPVRIVVLVVVLPVRMAWDALAAAARFVHRAVLRPTGRGLAWALTGVNRGLGLVFTGVGRGVAWVFRHTVTRPARWLYGAALAPVGRGVARVLTGMGQGLGWLFTRVGRGLAWLFTGVGRGLAWFFGGIGRGLARFLGGAWRGIAVGADLLWRGLSVAAAWLARALFVWPWVGLWRYLVVPVCRYGIAVPAVWLYRQVVAPLGTGILFLLENAVFVPVAALFRYVLVPLLRYGVVVPVLWFDRYVLTPVGQGLGWFFPRLGRGLAAAAAGTARAVFVWPWVGLWRFVLVPVVRYGIAGPLVWLWTRVLVPVAREVRDALAVCWRVAGYVSLAVGRALRRAFLTLVGRPVTWFWRSVCTPVGHWVRDSVWTPARRAAVQAGLVAKAVLASTRAAVRESLASARAAVREARRDAWRALVGSVRSSGSGEPEAARARTLGSTTNVPGAAPAPEISLRKRG
ncbi:hypothetical protein [Streptomyces sp. NBC_00691]|uniref:hypothetical protein n=1 Tax=Streptomyces sp. NBC_00691 TaxID=2903671 RepID=UPI002E2F098A|nr:hypothetical protein [Streptomyces sp. NBC_00691]